MIWPPILRSTRSSPTSSSGFSRRRPTAARPLLLAVAAAFERIKGLADDILLLLNQRNMELPTGRRRAERGKLDPPHDRGSPGGFRAVVSAGVLTRLILGRSRGDHGGPCRGPQGDLDQVVPATTRDELGELGQAFNVMARTIREFREARPGLLRRAADGPGHHRLVSRPGHGRRSAGRCGARQSGRRRPPARHSGHQRRHAPLDCPGASETSP